MSRGQRSISPIGHVIEQLRIAKGWSVEDLAVHAGLTAKTVESAERGEEKYARTVKAIADALGTDVPTLCGLEQGAKTFEGIEWSVTFKIPKEVLADPKTAEALATLLKGAVDALQAVIPLSVRAGSVILDCVLQSEDAKRLIDAFYEGKLERIGVSRIHMVAFPPALKHPPSYEATIHLLLAGYPRDELIRIKGVSPLDIKWTLEELGGRYKLPGMPPTLEDVVQVFH